MSVIEIKNLTKNYGKSRGVTELNLTVKEKDFFGFIGPNGAGKSTTIRTLLGLINPTSGEAFIFGKSLANAPEYLSDIGYLPSETMFYDNMKVGELISYSAKLRKKDCLAEAKVLCERLNVDTKKRLDELSLGNRKKVGIVCAMQHRPRLYIMDEPTTGLDPLMQKEFFSLLKERNNEGATIFFSSHILSEVQHNCTEAAIIREGRLAAVDSIENLSRTGAKQVMLRGINTIPGELNAKIVMQSNDSITFLYQGEIKALINAIQKLDINDITVTEPELEEVFLHYYEK